MNKRIKVSPEEIDLALAMAKERIESAEVLLKVSNYRDAISRAYYAFFDAASAALLTKGLVPKTHPGLIVLFGKHFIKTNKISVKMGRWLAKARQARQEADYERKKEISKKSVQATIKAAKEFVKTVETIVKSDA